MNTELDPPAQDPEPGWSQSLANGAPGIALLHIERARSGLGPWSAAQRWAAATTRRQVSAHPSMSLYRGAPAVAFALHAAEQAAYGPALSTFDARVRQIAEHRLAAAHDRIDRRCLPDLAEFDLISGMTGIGAYLLYRDQDDSTLRSVLTYLVRLTQPIPTACGELPGWWSANGPQDKPSLDWVGGHANLGMAHGIAGPLALLSTAMRRGVTVAGQAEAIEHVCCWLDRQRGGSPGQPRWPGTISLAELRSGAPRVHIHRPSWCYGTPGLARAQQLAGIALGDRHRQRLGEDALNACINDELQLPRIDNATLCHGWAGLVLTVWRVAADSVNPGRFTDRLPHLLDGLARAVRDHPLRHDALLEGAIGVQLAQHAATGSGLPQSRWDACLLLDG
jgi:hypothetical protein